jgi:hypothetical protein
MAGREDQAEEVVADVVVEGRIEIRLGGDLDLASDLLVLALEGLPAAQAVDGLMLRGPHEPGARVVRNA